jgi:hypothetical protein
MTSINSISVSSSSSLGTRPASRSIGMGALVDGNLGRNLGLGHELRAGRDSIWSQSDDGSISADF